MQSEAFQVVVGTGERGDFDLAAITRSGVNFADVQRMTQQLTDARINLSGDDFDLPVFCGATGGLSKNGGIQNLSEQRLHYLRSFPAARRCRPATPVSMAACVAAAAPRLAPLPFETVGNE